MCYVTAAEAAKVIGVTRITTRELRPISSRVQVSYFCPMLKIHMKESVMKDVGTFVPILDIQYCMDIDGNLQMLHRQILS